MSLRFHEIAEARHRILNPLTDDELALLGENCNITPGIRQLDLACGKGELLSRWSAEHGLEGVGVDISQVFLGAARARTEELGVSERVEFVEADAGTYETAPESFDIVSCIGATWIRQRPQRHLVPHAPAPPPERHRPRRRLLLADPARGPHSWGWRTTTWRPRSSVRTTASRKPASSCWKWSWPARTAGRQVRSQSVVDDQRLVARQPGRS
ncbi:class I SAM-dependent methyltransferase [Nonomuraea wenchangensis]